MPQKHTTPWQLPPLSPFLFYSLKTVTVFIFPKMFQKQTKRTFQRQQTKKKSCYALQCHTCIIHLHSSHIIVSLLHIITQPISLSPFTCCVAWLLSSPHFNFILSFSNWVFCLCLFTVRGYEVLALQETPCRSWLESTHPTTSVVRLVVMVHWFMVWFVWVDQDYD